MSEEKEGKGRHTVWLSEDAWETVRSMYRRDNCTTQNEFIEKAILFYDAYLSTKNASAFLPEALSTMITGTLDMFADRMGSVILKSAIEQNVCNHIIALDTDMDAQTYQQLRGKSVREVKSTNGKINFKEVLHAERSQ